MKKLVQLLFRSLHDYFDNSVGSVANESYEAVSSCGSVYKRTEAYSLYDAFDKYLRLQVYRFAILRQYSTCP